MINDYLIGIYGYIKLLPNISYYPYHYSQQQQQNKHKSRTMAEQEDYFYVQPEEEQFREIRQIQQPMPIYDKPAVDEPKNVNLKMIEIPREIQPIYYKPFKFASKAQNSSEEDQQQLTDWNFDQSPFTNYYNAEQCVFKKFHNQTLYKLNNIPYFAGCFIHRNVFIDSIKQQVRDLTDIIKDYYEVNTNQLPQQSTTTLKFSSNFQSGNLFASFKISANEYDLVMQNDTNSKGNNQWFYFKVQGMTPNQDYTFNVVNFTKSDSLFNYGMAPAIFSETMAEKEGEEWHRAGKDVSYKKGHIPRQNSRRFYYKLSFKISTKYQNDTVHIAHSYPYTYSMLKQYINDKMTKHKQLVTKIHIGKTLGRNNLEALQITTPNNKKKDTRKAIIIMARQHPGQTQGSFVCQGVVQKILTRNKQGDFLRKNYVIYVIPMINPDGVIFGHYRTNLAGYDLNRKWDSTQKQLNCPEVTCIKAFIQEISKERDIRFILDLHGHSKKLNSFFYGNPCPENPDVVRVYPYVCGKLNPAIQFYDCTFASEQYKRKAARVYLSFLYRLIHVYTFESSFYGFFKDGQTIQFTPDRYRDLGTTLVQCLFMQLEHQIKFQQSFQFSLSKGVSSKQYANSPFVKYLTQLKSNTQLMQIGSKCQSGSDSKPDEGQIGEKQLQKTKKISRDSSIPQISQQSQLMNKSSNRVNSRKGNRQVKQYRQVPLKPTRNLKVLQISRVNSILPDKYQMGLQPIRKKQASQGLVRNTSSILKIPIQSQTDPCQDSILKQYTSTQIIQKNFLSYTSRAQTPSTRDRKFSSVMKTQNRNNIIFKIDILNKQAKNKQTSNKRKQMKNVYIQTIISFCEPKSKTDRNRSSQFFPTVQVTNDTPANRKWSSHRYDTMKISSKKQTEIFLQGMVKKYFAQKQMKFRDYHIIGKVTQRPLSIQKKQLFHPRK